MKPLYRLISDGFLWTVPVGILSKVWFKSEGEKGSTVSAKAYQTFHCSLLCINILVITLSGSCQVLTDNFKFCVPLIIFPKWWETILSAGTLFWPVLTFWSPGLQSLRPHSSAILVFIVLFLPVVFSSVLVLCSLSKLFSRAKPAFNSLGSIFRKLWNQTKNQLSNT